MTETTASSRPTDPDRSPSPWLLGALALWGLLFITWQPFAWYRVVFGVVLLTGAAWAAVRRIAWGRRRASPPS